MNVNVLAFGIAKDIFGKSSINFHLDGETTADLKNSLEQQYPRLKQLASYMVAVNNEYAQDEDVLTERDEIAIIPPRKRGLKSYQLTTQIKISDKPLDIQSCIDWVMSSQSGGIDVFIGTVRDSTKGKPVIRLEFEAYAPMALKEMEKIAAQAFEKWPVQKLLIHHRTGILEVGEVPVVITFCAHRDAAFEACRYVIDTLKQTVPIWKKEIFEDGEVWVAAHP